MLSKSFLVLGTKTLILMAENKYEFLKSNALWILPSVSHFSEPSTALNQSLSYHKELAHLGGTVQPRNKQMSLTSVSNTTVQYPGQYKVGGNSLKMAVCISMTVVPIANLPAPNSLTVAVWVTGGNKFLCLKGSSHTAVPLL